MARVKNGIIGMLSGKIGSLVVYPMYGKLYARSVPANNPQKIKSKAHLAQLNKVKILGSFLNHCIHFIKIGYKSEALAKQKSAYGLSQSWHLKNAVKGEYPDQEIDWTQIHLSSGKLRQAENLRISMQEAQIRLDWDNPPKLSFEEREQQTMVLVYCEETKQVYTTLYKAQKKDGMQILSLPVKVEKNNHYHVYFNFKSLLTDEVSTSCYISLVPVPETQIELQESSS